MALRLVGLGFVLLALSWMFLAWRVWKIERHFLGARSRKRRPVVLYVSGAREAGGPN